MHGAALLAEWKRPYPPYASIALDGAALPPVDPAWSELDRYHYESIVEALAYAFQPSRRSRST